MIGYMFTGKDIDALRKTAFDFYQGDIDLQDLIDTIESAKERCETEFEKIPHFDTLEEYSQWFDKQVKEVI